MKENNIFDITTTGMSFYDDLLPDSPKQEYMNKMKNIKGEIKYLTPNDYFKECAYNIFKYDNTSVDKLIASRTDDEYSTNKIKNSLLDGNKLPLTMLDYANNSQEGLHRMLVVGNLFGWDNLYPVLIINKFKETSNEEVNINDLQNKLESAIKNSLNFVYGNIEQYKDELSYYINKEFTGEYYNGNNISFNIKEDNDDLIIELTNYPVFVTLDKNEINIKETIDDYLSDIDYLIDDDILLDEHYIHNVFSSIKNLK